MLALAFAAAHPGMAGPIALIGCGTFDTASRATLEEDIGRRLTDHHRQGLERIRRDLADPDARMSAIGSFIAPLYSHDLVDMPDPGVCDHRGHEETWADMLRLQDEGVIPGAFRVITAPVLMLHGRDDPHPGAMIRDRLQRVMPHLQYVEFDRCGHYPWLERHARDAFLEVLRRWLGGHSG